MNFMGYRRPDGKAGIRNKVLILPRKHKKDHQPQLHISP